MPRSGHSLVKLTVPPGVFMAKSSKLLNGHERMVAAADEKHRLMPERLLTLVAAKFWIRAVSQHSQAQQAFREAAIDFCRSEKARTQMQSHKVQSRTRTLREIADQLARTGFMTGTGKPYAAAVAKMIEA
jgi:hypothetical protein